MDKTLKDTLREIQILLGRPGKQIAGTLKYYLKFLNLAEKEEEVKKPSTRLERMQKIRHGKITWTDIRDPSRREIGKLAEKYPFHPLHLEDCISKWQFPKIEQNDEDKYLFILLRMPHYNPQEGRIIISQMCFFLGQDYLVTTHEDIHDAIFEVFNACRENFRQRKVYFGKSASYLFYVLIDHLSAELSPLLQTIIKEVDEVEDIVFDDKISGVEPIGKLRQKITSLRRTIGPLRTVLADMVPKINRISRQNLSVYFDNIIHRVEKALETLEESRETIEIYKDADFTLSTEKSSRVLTVLTVIFTLTIPATVIGSFYGMNILLPGGIEHGSWTFWGDYTTLIIILLLAIIPALLLQLYFRKRGWL